MACIASCWELNTKSYRLTHVVRPTAEHRTPVTHCLSPPNITKSVIKLKARRCPQCSSRIAHYLGGNVTQSTATDHDSNLCLLENTRWTKPENCVELVHSFPLARGFSCAPSSICSVTLTHECISSNRLSNRTKITNKIHIYTVAD